jgi:hypothetical protein
MARDHFGGGSLKIVGHAGRDPRNRRSKPPRPRSLACFDPFARGRTILVEGDWSDEETDEPPIADHRNFYKVEQWNRDAQRVERMLFVGNFRDRARAIFKAEIRRRPRGHYTIRQHSRVLDQWPPQD